METVIAWFVAKYTSFFTGFYRQPDSGKKQPNPMFFPFPSSQYY
jgi:hypothetical protein